MFSLEWLCFIAILVVLRKYFAYFPGLLLQLRS
ncbi:hypothetical protein AGR7B_Cc150123 [Agrobacterium deltaense RV3]|nr:hypothetical protein AGR7B_Cc150123 [Agrobacterium deltaense RV3]